MLSNIIIYFCLQWVMNVKVYLSHQHYPSKDEQATATEGEYSHAQDHLQEREGVESIRTLSKSEWEALCECTDHFVTVALGFPS